MAIDLKNSIFFNAGKRIKLTAGQDAGQLLFTKNDNGSWKVNVEFIITAEEAAKVIAKYDDFKVDTPEGLETQFPNQVYFEAFNADNSSKNIACKNMSLVVLHDKEEEGSIQISLSPQSLRKTQNSNL